MAYLTKQIQNLVNDSANDALGANASTISELDTSDVVSLGKAISQFDAFEGFYKALTNRIVKTVYFVRTYEGSKRSVLRDEHEYGAFIQKVYYKMPKATANPTWNIPNATDQYKQESPYDVEETIAVSSMTFGGKGTWTIEIVRPIEQIKSAFLNPSNMMSFIDGIYITVENSFKFEEERLTATAVNTAMAHTLNSSKAAQKRNLLAEYNTAHPTNTLTVAQCLENADFLRFASMEIKKTITNLSKMSTVFNTQSYETFTSKDNLVVEMLTHFVSAYDVYLQADTFHNEITSLPKYEEVPFWQSSGSAFSFSDCSKIKIAHNDINSGTATEQGGIICFLHDVENVACYFGNKRSWEMVNPRSEVVIHGEKAEKGFAVDGHANAVVFYIAA